MQMQHGFEVAILKPITLKKLVELLDNLRGLRYVLLRLLQPPEGVLVEAETGGLVGHAHREGLRRVAEGGEGRVIGQTVELAAIRREGWEIPIELSLSAAQVDGEWCAVGIVREIAERKRIEERVRRERERAQRYLDVASTMLVALDSQARITLINRAGCEALGWSSEELLAHALHRQVVLRTICSIARRNAT